MGQTRQSAFDQMQVFSFDDAARALVFDQHGWMVPMLPTKLTAEGVAYHTWLDVLTEAINVEPVLNVSVYEGDKEQKWYIQREHFKQWCQARGLSPRFLFGDSCRSDNERDTSSVVDRRIDAILIAISAKGWDANEIPDGGKAQIKEICLKQAKLFTDSTFDAAWKRAPVTMKSHATFTKGR